MLSKECIKLLHKTDVSISGQVLWIRDLIDQQPAVKPPVCLQLKNKVPSKRFRVFIQPKGWSCAAAEDLRPVACWNWAPVSALSPLPYGHWRTNQLDRFFQLIQGACHLWWTCMGMPGTSLHPKFGPCEWQRNYSSLSTHCKMGNLPQRPFRVVIWDYRSPHSQLWSSHNRYKGKRTSSYEAWDGVMALLFHSRAGTHFGGMQRQSWSWGRLLWKQEMELKEGDRNWNKQKEF